MPQTITWKKELIRIHPKNAERLEASADGGKKWNPRYAGGCGEFGDMECTGREILANTDRGLFTSINGGRSWVRRGD